MAVDARRSLVLAAAVASLTCSVAAQATDYNVLVFGNFNEENSDVEGALAAKGNVTLKNFGVGDKLTAADNASPTLVAGGKIDFTNGQLFHGNAAASSYGGNFNVLNGSKTVAAPLNFTALEAQYKGYSAGLAGQTPNGTTLNQYGTLTLTGTSTGLNVFQIDGSITDPLNSLNLIIPTNAYALINVTGLSAGFTNMGFNTGATSLSNILFNLPTTTSLALTGIGFNGSVLAPNAAVQFGNGQFNGQLIAQSVTGSGEFHVRTLDSAAFFKDPSTPAVPEPAAWLMMITGFGAVGTLLRRRRAVEGVMRFA